MDATCDVRRGHQWEKAKTGKEETLLSLYPTHQEDDETLWCELSIEGQNLLFIFLPFLLIGQQKRAASEQRASPSKAR